MIAGNVSVLCVVVEVRGVTQLNNIVYVVYKWSKEIFRFDANGRRDYITAKGLTEPRDIVACERTSHVYVADKEWIWQVAANGKIRFWVSPLAAFTPRSLSVTSTRLLVTSFRTDQLVQFDADGQELRRISSPRVTQPQHAVETPAGTFVISHSTPEKRGEVVEVDAGGEVLRQFSGSRLISLGETPRVANDSHDNILVADGDNCRVLLLDADLCLRDIILDEHQLKYKRPSNLCYIGGELLVGLVDSVSAVCEVLHCIPNFPGTFAVSRRRRRR